MIVVRGLSRVWWDRILSVIETIAKAFHARPIE